jgi:hypothetical protein
MQKNYIVLGAILVLLLIAFFWSNNYVYQAKQADLSAYSLGSYAYQCTDGAGFVMSPSQDMNTIYLQATAGAAPMSANILTKVAGTNARYEGDGIVFAGNGETVIITAPGYQTSCTPVQDAENAPFNFGDPEQNAENEAWTPDRVTLEGEYVCLPHRDTSGPVTMECAFGLRTDTAYYAIDFALMSQDAPQLSTGDRFRANGIFTPVETLSSDRWQTYDIAGIFSVTDSVEKF